MKQPIAFKLLQGLAIIAGLMLIAALAVGQPAHATGNGQNQPRAEADADARSDASAHAGALAGAHAQSGDNSATGGAAYASGTGGEATGVGMASNDGNTLDAGDTSNRTTFFSFNSSIPAAGQCFGAVNGGGGDGGGGGFLGWNFLNKDCWYSALAAEEKSVEVRARLKCGSKAFRNAISYTEKRGDRQQHCVSYMIRTFVEQIEFEKEQVQAMLDSQTLLINGHTTTETERTSASTTRAVERCTDCFGEKSK
jgi:hypothetical protein